MPESSQDSSAKPRTLPRFSKRHASFESPREIPLPSPTIQQAENSNSSPYFLVAPSPRPSAAPRSPRCYLDDQGQPPSPTFARPRSPSSPIALHYDSSLIASRRQRLHSSRQLSLGTNGASQEISRESRAADQSSPVSTPSQLTPTDHARPLVVSDSHSFPFYQQHSPGSPHLSTAWIDRNSSASLPIPSQIPFHALPNAPSLEPIPASSISSPNMTPLPPAGTFSTERPHMRHLGVDDSSRNSSSSDSSSSSSSSSASASSTTTTSTTASSLNTDPRSSEFDKSPPLPVVPPSNLTRSDSRPTPRPVSPFRAPQPPAVQPRPPPMAEWTAMRRYMTPAQLQNTSALSAVSAAMSHASHSHSASTSSSTSSTLSSASYPPPEPPTILPQEARYDAMQAGGRVQAPYVPFLSHAPPPADSWIEVETTLDEYKLHVRLPGFTREGITLATKRRRILHVVADSWENGGGHFERRIAFGYDADLVQVRAEFDGVMLRIIVPRRVSPVTWNAPPARLGPMGRV